MNTHWHALIGLLPITLIAVVAFVAQVRERRRQR
jgi:hypothetical protein